MKKFVVFTALSMTLAMAVPAQARTEYELLGNGQVAVYRDDVRNLTPQERVYERKVAANYQAMQAEAVRESLRDTRGIQQTFSRQEVAMAPVDREVKRMETNEVRQQHFDAQDQYFVQPERAHKTLEAELGSEVYAYKYEETNGGSTFMTNEGAYAGLAGALMFTPDLGNAILPDMFRIEARIAGGRVDYSSATESYSGLNDYVYEVRGLVGKRIAIGRDSTLTPYLGLGWRYLNDGLEDAPATSTTFSGYNRESRYFYLPVGIEYETAMAGGWRFKGNLEGAWLIEGEQTSHFEDERDRNGVPSGFPTAVNKQDTGYGIRASLRFAREFTRSRTSFFVEPFYRYWYVDQSDFTQVTSPRYPGQYFLVAEPENTTQEAGVKVGMLF